MIFESLSKFEEGGLTDDLVERAKAGDERAYNQLFLRLEDRLTFYIKLRLGRALKEKLDAYDVLQETYLHAHRSFDRFTANGEGAFCRWMYRIIDNRIRDIAQHLNAQKRRPEKGFVQGTGILDAIRTDMTTPSAVFVRQEEQERLIEAMEDLSEEEREALILRYFQDLTLVKIAEQLDRSEPGVRRLLGRARLKLGKRLKASQ